MSAPQIARTHRYDTERTPRFRDLLGEVGAFSGMVSTEMCSSGDDDDDDEDDTAAATRLCCSASKALY